jgi:hypothetical protein
LGRYTVVVPRVRLLRDPAACNGIVMQRLEGAKAETESG